MVKKHSVALILPYYGKFPNYFPLWLKTAGYNKKFDFFVFTDADYSCYEIPENVHFFESTFDDIKSRIGQYLDFKFVLESPYKLCDYKPLYGLVFHDYLQDYEFWGHVDPDIIWGDMSKFITDYILDNYDRIYQRGHLTIYRNTDKINNFVLHKLPNYNISYRDVYKVPFLMYIEESALTENLFSNFAVGGGGHNRQFDSVDCADLYERWEPFYCYRYGMLSENLPAFVWDKGTITGLALYGDPARTQEYLYIHLQKRQMKFDDSIAKLDKFMILPTEFTEFHDLTREEIDDLMKPNPEYERRHNEKYNTPKIPNVSKWNIIGRIKNFFKRSPIERIIRIKGRWNQFRKRRLRSRWSGEWRGQF